MTRETGPAVRWGLLLAVLGAGFVVLRLLERRVERIEREGRAAPAAGEMSASNASRRAAS